MRNAQKNIKGPGVAVASVAVAAVASVFPDNKAYPSLDFDFDFD